MTKQKEHTIADYQTTLNFLATWYTPKISVPFFLLLFFQFFLKNVKMVTLCFLDFDPLQREYYMLSGQDNIINIADAKL